MAEHRAQQDRKRPEDHLGDQSYSYEAAAEAQAVGPWNASNTLLLENEESKARLQMYNRIPISSYSLSQGDAIREMRKQAIVATKGTLQVNLYSIEMAPEWARNSILQRQGNLTTEEENAAREVAWDFLLRMDSALLQTIGALDESLHQAHVGRWIKSGGLEGYAGANPLPDNITGGIILRSLKEADALAKSGLQQLVSDTSVDTSHTTLDWILRGVRACAARGIPLNLEQEFGTSNI